MAELRPARPAPTIVMLRRSFEGIVMISFGGICSRDENGIATIFAKRAFVCPYHVPTSNTRQMIPVELMMMYRAVDRRIVFAVGSQSSLRAAIW